MNYDFHNDCYPSFVDPCDEFFATLEQQDYDDTSDDNWACGTLQLEDY